MNVLFDAFDVIALALPNRPIIEVQGLTVAQAARIHRLLATGMLGRALNEFVPMVLPYRFGSLRRTRKARKLLYRIRGAEVSKVLERVLVGVSNMAEIKAKKDDSPPPSFEDMIAEYAKLYGFPQASDPWLLVLRCMERIGLLEARDLLRSMDAEAFGAASAQPGKHHKKLGALHKMLKRMAYPPVVSDA